MATKRKFEDDDENHQEIHVSNKKHTLDSDEEDSDDYEKDELNYSDIEGEEEGVGNEQDDVKVTPFNMREELQEGHFDTEGQYHWNKDSEVKDNWLDNIDWVKVKSNKDGLNVKNNEDSNDSTKMPEAYNEIQAYADIFSYMEPNETVQRTLQRLGKSRTKMSSAERIRRKKAGIVDEAADKIMKFTELTNDLLTHTGNMDIYQETYEQIQNKITNSASTSKVASRKINDSFDMYADDFEEKERNYLETSKQSEKQPAESAKTSSAKSKLQWEFKRKQDDTKLEGPYSTEQMLKWSQDGYFKDGVYVRKVGESSKFYSSSRIDFDLYL